MGNLAYDAVSCGSFRFTWHHFPKRPQSYTLACMQQSQIAQFLTWTAITQSKFIMVNVTKYAATSITIFIFTEEPFLTVVEEVPIIQNNSQSEKKTLCF
jgi:hypothetical protein